MGTFTILLYATFYLRSITT